MQDSKIVQTRIRHADLLKKQVYRDLILIDLFNTIVRNRPVMVLLAKFAYQRVSFD